jgi:polyribonucleotide nucleotidyltransferase
MYVRFPLSLRNVEDLLLSVGSTSVTTPCATAETGSRHLPL